MTNSELINFFNMTLRGGGNDDTMIDLISDTGGGSIIATLAGLRTKIKNKEET